MTRGRSARLAQTGPVVPTDSRAQPLSAGPGVLPLRTHRTATALILRLARSRILRVARGGGFSAGQRLRHELRASPTRRRGEPERRAPGELNVRCPAHRLRERQRRTLERELHQITLRRPHHRRRDLRRRDEDLTLGPVREPRRRRQGVRAWQAQSIRAAPSRPRSPIAQNKRPDPSHLSFTSGQPQRPLQRLATTTPRRTLPRTSGSNPHAIPWDREARQTAQVMQHQGTCTPHFPHISRGLSALLSDRHGSVTHLPPVGPRWYFQQFEHLPLYC